MYPTSVLIPHLSNLPAYGSYSGALVDGNGAVRWTCGHVHSFDSTARDCAEYERQKRLRGN